MVRIYDAAFATICLRLAHNGTAEIVNEGTRNAFELVETATEKGEVNLRSTGDITSNSSTNHANQDANTGTTIADNSGYVNLTVRSSNQMFCSER